MFGSQSRNRLDNCSNLKLIQPGTKGNSADDRQLKRLSLVTSLTSPSSGIKLFSRCVYVLCCCLPFPAMSRSNSVSPPGVGAPGLRGGTEHRSAWGEAESVANGCPYSARSPRKKLTRTNSRWREEDDSDRGPPGRASTTVSRVSFRSRSAWQDHGEENRDNASAKRPENEVRPKSVELGLEERRAKPRSDEDEVMPEVNFSFVACCVSVMHVFKSKKFQSEKLERLYQRYFFRLNQSSLTMLMAVLVLVFTVMLGFHCSGGTSGPSVTYVTVFSLAIFLTLILMVVCNRNGFHQDHMWVVCYVVILLVLVIQVIGVLLVQPRSASEGIWWTVFFIHVIYTLLPVRMRAAVITGIILSAIHVAISWMLNGMDSFLWKQVRERMQFVCKVSLQALQKWHIPNSLCAITHGETRTPFSFSQVRIGWWVLNKSEHYISGPVQCSFVLRRKIKLT